MKKIHKNGNYYLIVDNDIDKRTALRAAEFTDKALLVPEHPELVDIKLTDVCHIGCAFCYQSSTGDSRHGQTEKIKSVIDQIDGNITEVAYGGGDVLQHPDIVDILRYSKERGIKSSNITMNWQSIMKYPEKVSEVTPLVDAFGISITGPGQVKKVVEKLKEIGCFRPTRNCFHIIPDIYPRKVVRQMIADISHFAPQADILFLGFKALGRGATFEPKQQDMKTMAEYFLMCKQHGLNLQCDTKLVKDYLSVVSEYSDPSLYDIHEGEFSMNIDCVDDFCSIASYNLSYKWPLVEIATEGIPATFMKIRKAIGLQHFEKEGK